MTTFLPHRHADDDAIDDALNALVAGESSTPATSAAADAILTQRSAMSALQRHPAAQGPAAGTWNQVLRATAQPAAKGNQEMSAIAYLPTDIPQHARPVRSSRDHINSFMRYAASILGVGGLAFSSWFALSNQPGNDDPGGRLAAIPGTPIAGSATCDVEPLTVDEVMAIVENPQSYMFDGATASPVAYDQTGSNTNQLRVMETDLELVPGNLQPTEQQFADASHVANAYLACLLSGTQGQVWSFYAPSAIQSTVLAEFPVFADESTVRARVEERLIAPAVDGEFQWSIFLQSFGASQLSVNPDRLLAVSQDSSSSYYLSVIHFGISALDDQGNDMYLSNGVGTALKPLDPMAGTMGMAITLAKSRSSDVWFVFPFPSLAEIEAM